MGKDENLRTRIITGNWKLNKSVHEAIEYVSVLKSLLCDVAGVEVVLAPSFTVLATVARVLDGSSISLSAQDVFWERSGAFTGEISPVMLKDVGCEYVIIGHSERRQYFGETNETVNKKVKAAHAHGLKPIMCVGESFEDRKSGRTEAIIKANVVRGIAGLSELEILSTVIAYEPVWAIGTGVTAIPQQVQEVHEFIRSLLAERYSVGVAAQVRLQYGGSVKPDNTVDLLSQVDVDGALVGGASLDADLFAQIVEISSTDPAANG